ncbi:MAG TPA: preprotein translocase subunit SecG [Proteobacteria bacterium]|nr:preprotein translocase subunit SecG [Pseudomonadota bacterium]
MITVITIIHIVAAIFLILVILLQAGKGAELGAVFGGGGSQAVFGPAGAAPLMSKLTTIAAIVFMATCLALAYHSAKTRTVMPEAEQQGQTESGVPAAGQQEQGQPVETESGQTESGAVEGAEAAAPSEQQEAAPQVEPAGEQQPGAAESPGGVGAQGAEAPGVEPEAAGVDNSQDDQENKP